MDKVDENLNLLRDYCKLNSIIVKCRVSYKITVEKEDSERYTFCLGKISEINVKEILELYTENKKVINYILRHYNDYTSFIVSITNDGIRFYVDKTFIMNQIGIYSVEILEDKEKYHTYVQNPIDIQYYDPRLKEIMHLLDNNSILIRDDGQQYLRFNKKIKSDLIETITTSEKMKEWIRSQNSNPVWIQFNEQSLTIYYKI
jgi:hypothetical protein